MSMKELVVCKFMDCNQVYTDPRILPCGKRTCAAHIPEMMMESDCNSSTRKLKCHFCHKIHTCPDNEEFPVDENIPLLLSIKHSSEHDAAKKSFEDVTQLLDKLLKLDKEACVIQFFDQAEDNVLQEKETNLQKLLAYYQRLVDHVRGRKEKCLHNLKTNKRLESELAAIERTLVKSKSKLKTEELDMILKTLDGDEAKWREIRAECSAMLDRMRSLGEELKEKLVGNEKIRFRSGDASRTHTFFGHIEERPIDSRLISSYKMKEDLVELCNLGDKQFRLLYRASRDGFQASSFHAKCDNQPRTLTIVRGDSVCLFGGFAAVAWDSTSKYMADPHAFLFSIVNFTNTPQVFPLKAGNEQSIYCDAASGPSFGSGHDLFIADDSHVKSTSYSVLGCSYDVKLPPSSVIKERTLLAGACNFQTLEIEVFQLN